MFANGGISVALWVFLAFAVERFVEVVLKAIPSLDKRTLLGIEVPVLLSFAFSLVTAIGTGLDFFRMFDISFLWPCVGYVFAALVMTGGSNLIHDIVGWVKVSKEIGEARATKMK